MDWKYLYREYYGNDIPFNIAMYNDSGWGDIIEFIELTYNHVILDDKRTSMKLKLMSI